MKVELCEADNVKHIFDLYANHGCTIDMVAARLNSDGRTYTAKQPHWVRSKIHRILRDRSYIGDLKWHGHWQPGKHVPIVDRQTFQRVQSLLGDKEYKAHELLYAGELIFCGHCGRPITGEIVKKKSGKEYVYYRCARYTSKDHPRSGCAKKKLILRSALCSTNCNSPSRCVSGSATRSSHRRRITKSKPAPAAPTFSVNSTRRAASRSGY